jgi:DegV family protein with EDD domain
MKTQLVVDAACDLPPAFINNRDIVVIPLTVTIDGETSKDERDPVSLLHRYESKSISIKHTADSSAPTVIEIEALFEESIIPESKYALVQTTSNKRSKTFAHCEQAQKQILAQARLLVSDGIRETPFGMRVMNSATMFSGQGLLAAFTSDLIGAQKSTKDIVRLAEAFKSRIFAYALPADVSYVRERARKRGEDSVSLIGSLVAKSLDIKPIIQFRQDETQIVSKTRGFDKAANSLFDYAAAQIKNGLLSPYVVISFAGDPSELTQFESFGQLLTIAKQANVELLTTTMGLAGGLNLGIGAISLALAAEDHEFEG